MSNVIGKVEGPALDMPTLLVGPLSIASSLTHSPRRHQWGSAMVGSTASPTFCVSPALIQAVASGMKTSGLRKTRDCLLGIPPPRTCCILFLTQTWGGAVSPGP